jgi:oxygen-independent coproporphyrinogen-3 oxidase
VKKCSYCDFNSHEKNSSFDEKKYLTALLKDLDNEYRNNQQRNLSSIFFGGGTPSLFSADSIHSIIAHAKDLFKFDKIETTLEANPGTFEQEKFSDFKYAGVNRLSIGIQSFNDSHLKRLGRIHDREQALTAIETAKRAGFENINLDLMFGLPQQTMQQAIKDIKIACEFDVPHISHYQLTIEENTYFHKYTPELPESDLIWEMQTECQNMLIDKQYNQYEISAYSKTGQSCTHNMNYWLFGDYIGIGAGAHGKLTNKIESFNKELTVTRRWKHRQPKQYIKNTLNGNALAGKQQLKQQDVVFEFLLNALRLKAGCDIQTFKKHTGLDYRALKTAVKNIDSSLLLLDKNKITTTDKGYLFLNTILQELLEQ